MSEVIFLIILAYVFLAIILQVIIVYSPIAIWIKFFIIAIMSIFYFVTYQSLNGSTGWPSDQNVPKKFILNASLVVEPNKKDNTTGQIYLWLTSITHNKPDLEPRAYQLDYSEQLHLTLEQADKKLRRGLVQMGEVDKNNRGGSEARSAFSNVDNIKIYDLPLTHLPEK